MRIYNLGAAVTALVGYVVVALAVGWLFSAALAGASPTSPRFLAEAAVSTIVGMVVSRGLTATLFPFFSGRVVFAVFAGVTIATIAVGVVASGAPPSGLPTLQSLLLISLAYGLFWTRERRNPDASRSREMFSRQGRRG